MSIKIGIGTNLQIKGGGSTGVNGNPTNLTLSVILDVQINLSWTIGSTNQDGHRIYISTNGINFTLKGTVAGTTATYSATGLTAGTKYYFYVVAYKSTKESNPTNTANATTFDAEIGTYISGLSTPLTLGQLTNLNTLVRALKSGLTITNLSDYFEVFYVLAGETEESSLKNLVANNYHATLNSTPAWAKWEGYTGASGKYIKTGFNPKTNAKVIAAADTSQGIYCRTPTLAYTYDCGCAGFGSERFFLMTGTPATVFKAMINTNFESSGSTASSAGMVIGMRYAAGAGGGKVYRNGTVGANTDLNVGLGLPDNTVYILTIHNSDGSAGSASAKQASVYFIGKSMTSEQVTSVTNAIEAYMDANGKGVI